MTHGGAARRFADDGSDGGAIPRSSRSRRCGSGSGSPPPTVSLGAAATPAPALAPHDRAHGHDHAHDHGHDPAHGDGHAHDHGHDDHGHAAPPPGLTDAELNKDVGRGASTGVWVTGLIVVVLVLLAIFGLGGDQAPPAH